MKNSNNKMTDFQFLEDAGRVTDNLSRQKKDLLGGKQQATAGLKRQRLLYRRAADRGVRLTWLSKGLRRHEDNRSHFDGKRKLLVWSVEWIFHAGVAVGEGHRILEHGVAEDVAVKDKLLSFLSRSDVPWLESYVKAGPDSLCILYKRPFTPVRRPLLRCGRFPLLTFPLPPFCRQMSQSMWRLTCIFGCMKVSPGWQLSSSQPSRSCR